MLKSLIEFYFMRKWHKGKMRVVRLLLKTLPYQSIRSHYGVILSCTPQDLTNAMAISGNYGLFISDHIKSLSKDCVFIDIGANYGLYSNLAAQHLTDGTVLSFEPNPRTYRHFLLALDKNGYKNIIPFHCAIGEKDDALKLTYNVEHSGSSSLASSAGTSENTVTVPVFNIAHWQMLDFLKTCSSIHIKIDVEGYESSIVNVLKLAPWFEKVQSIIVEIDHDNLLSFGAGASELYENLEQDGFRSRYGLNTNKKHYDELFQRD